jgi:hypothetical protein
MRIWLIFIVLNLHFLGRSQEVFTKPSIQFDTRLPVNTGNKSFRTTMDGIAYGSIWFQMRVFKPVYLGMGTGLYYGKVNDNKLGLNVMTNGSITAWKPFVRLSYEHALNEQFILIGYVKGGYSMAQFKSAYCTTMEKGPKQEMPYAEGGFSIGMLGQEHFTVSFTIGYSLMFEEYGPEMVCLPYFNGLEATDSEGVYQFAHVGFGFGWYLTRQRGGFTLEE